MGNVSFHDLSPVREDERQELNLSKALTYTQFCKHVDGQADDSCHAEIPWDLRDSISLYERVDFSFNVLHKLPSELPLRLPHINYLDLGHNRISSLPDSFGLFFHLKTLLLRYNELETLPQSFVRLVKLKTLDLSDNYLTELPDCMGLMESISKINLTSNCLKSLPISLGDCKTLTLLLVVGNHLNSPPQSVCDEGSSVTISYLRKQYISHQSEFRIHRTLNDFPRFRGNQLKSSVLNPQSANVQYIQTQTHTANTPSRIKTPLLPPIGACQLPTDELKDRIIGMIYGAAIGDAIGVATRWMSPDECQFYYSHDTLTYHAILRDQHRIRWERGAWTSNFDQFLLVLDSVISWAGVVDELDFSKRLDSWARNGYSELGERPDSVVLTPIIAKVLGRQGYLLNPHAAAADVLVTNGDAAEDPNVQSSAAMRATTSIPNGDIGELDSSLSSLAMTENIPNATHNEIDGHPSCENNMYSISNSFKINSGSSQAADSLNHNPTTLPQMQLIPDNGAVIRTQILGVANFHNITEVEGNAVRICRATHADPRCIASSVVVSIMIALMLQGKHQFSSMESVENLIKTATRQGQTHLRKEEQVKEFQQYVQLKDIQGLKANQESTMNHTYKPMAAAIIALRSNMDYKQFLLKLTMAAGDSNSNTIVAGAVLGCRTGFARLPREWVDGLRNQHVTILNTKINVLLDMMGIS